MSGKPPSRADEQDRMRQCALAQTICAQVMFHRPGFAECLGAGEVAFELQFQQEEWEGGNSRQSEDTGSWT